MSEKSVENQHTVEESFKKELPYLFEKELVEERNKRIYVVEQYIPNVINVIPITLKFYSDVVDKPFLKYIDLVEYSRRLPNGRYQYPVLESHNYGWYVDSHLHKKISTTQSGICRKIRSDITKFGENLLCNRITERSKFNGIRFQLR